MNIFAHRLKDLRKERYMTLKEVSTELGMPLSSYANYEQGVREPSLETLKLICKFYDVTSDYLIGLSDSY